MLTSYGVAPFSYAIAGLLADVQHGRQYYADNGCFVSDEIIGTRDRVAF
jgi:hypothetical protein